MIEKTYTQATTAWQPQVNHFHDGVVEEIVVMVRDEERAQSGELMVSWIKFQTQAPTPKIECFLDGFLALEYVVLALQRHRRDGDEGTTAPDVTPEGFIAELEALGFEPSKYHNQLEREAS